METAFDHAYNPSTAWLLLLKFHLLHRSVPVCMRCLTRATQTFNSNLGIWESKIPFKTTINFLLNLRCNCETISRSTAYFLILGIPLTVYVKERKDFTGRTEPMTCVISRKKIRTLFVVDLHLTIIHQTLICKKTSHISSIL